MIHLGAIINAKDQIELRSSFDANLVNFLRSLPSARWNKYDRYWSCENTPATCWRIINEGSALAKLEADDEIRRRGQAFFASTIEPPCFDQPPVRKTEAWRHQCEAFHFSIQRHAALLWAAMGTGKTKITVDIAQNRPTKRILVLCPVSVRGVWRREFQKHATVPHEIIVLENGTTSRKAKELQDGLIRCRANNVLAIVVVNYESAWRGELFDTLKNWTWDMMVCDESARIKAHNSRQSKAAAELGRLAKFRLALTGTPLANSPLDIFGQFRFLDPGIFGSSWTRFRTQYAITGRLGEWHVVGFKNQDDLTRKMSLLTYHIEADVLNLPKELNEQIEFDLSPSERKVQDELATEMISFLDQGGEVTAPNGLVKLLRLAQVTGGHVKDDDGNIRSVGSSKQDMLLDLLEDIPEPVVVFCRFREDLRRVEAVANALKRRYGEISGNRKDLTEHATMPDGIDILGVQHQAGGLGIDLTRSRIGIFFNQPWSLGDFEQMKARINRPGQTRPVIFKYLLARNSVDQVVQKSLNDKTEVIDDVLDYLKSENEGECNANQRFSDRVCRAC